VADRGFETGVVVAGAGPCGLALAIELGRRDIPTTVIDPLAADAYKSPRTYLVNARTMEHLRRWGIADELRDRNPIGPDTPPDVVFATRMDGYELHRFHRPFVGEGIDDRCAEGAEWVPQRIIEATLADYAQTLPSLTFMRGCELNSLRQDPEGVTASVTTSANATQAVRGRWLAGCDGSRSVVRRELGIRLQGDADLLNCGSYHVRLPEFTDHATIGGASFYWFVNSSYSTRSGVILNRYDGGDGWSFALFPCPAELDPDDFADMREMLVASIGEQPIEFVSGGRWQMHCILAPDYRAGRCFVAGDAAHLVPPLGGFGMNVSVLDGIDLGWKLAAVEAGWGGPHLLPSYTTERRGAELWVAEAQKENAVVLSRDLYRAGMEEHTDEAARLRSEIAEQIVRTKAAEFRSLGAAKGYRYVDSPVIAYDERPVAPPDPVDYTPSGAPGSVAPHTWRGAERSLYDAFGPEFTLLATKPVPEAARVMDAAKRLGLPVQLLEIDDDALRAKYEANLALLRPDQHVAWRGDSAPERPEGLLNLVRGA
jgi:2-polyprenyl-6-methoxyphenol hydroxylase-like FAD-dependent oxidoreductase